MRYSVDETRVIIAQFKKNSIHKLDKLFNVETLPIFNELEGKTAGAILALNPKNPFWLQCIIHLTFLSPLGNWTGKEFLTPFSKDKKGYGMNLFKNKILNRLFPFDTYIKNAYVDNKPCLALDYRQRTLSFIGLVDDVRKIKDGLVLGQAYYQVPWKKQMWFVGYFILCSLNREKIT